MNILVNYLKDTQVDSQHIYKILNYMLPYDIKSFDHFIKVHEKYSYPKISLSEVLVWFEIYEPNTVGFKKNSNYSVLISSSNDIKTTMKNFFEKVCTGPDITDTTNPDYIKYTHIINWLNKSY